MSTVSLREMEKHRASLLPALSCLNTIARAAFFSCNSLNPGTYVPKAFTAESSLKCNLLKEGRFDHSVSGCNPLHTLAALSLPTFLFIFP